MSEGAIVSHDFVLTLQYEYEKVRYWHVGFVSFCPYFFVVMNMELLEASETTGDRIKATSRAEFGNPSLG